MQLTFLGTSAGVPTRTRNVTAMLLNLQHPTQPGLWLFDCGEGTQHQLLHTAFHPGKIERIFISHLHGDHLFGLPASALAGGLLLLVTDNVARTATTSEIPLGILTALIGTPAFAVLLRRTRAEAGHG